MKFPYTLNILTAIILTAVPLTAVPLTAAATTSNIDIQFERTPLFSDSAILPGQSVTRSVKIRNLNAENKNLAFQIRPSESSSAEMLASVQLIISQGKQNLYKNTINKTLGTETVIDQLGSNASKTYYVSLLLPAQAGNEFQNKKIGFDIDFGFSVRPIETITPEPTISGSPNPSPNSTPSLGGGGGGGAFFFSALVDKILGNNSGNSSPNSSVTPTPQSESGIITTIATPEQTPPNSKDLNTTKDFRLGSSSSVSLGSEVENGSSLSIPGHISSSSFVSYLLGSIGLQDNALRYLEISFIFLLILLLIFFLVRRRRDS